MALLLAPIAIPRLAAATKVTLEGGAGEVCRFRAGDAREPFQRWLASQEVTCAASGSVIDWPPGLWNVFGRSRGVR